MAVWQRSFGVVVIVLLFGLALPGVSPSVAQVSEPGPDPVQLSMSSAGLVMLETPIRFVDTRGLGSPIHVRSPLGPGGVIDVPIGGFAGIPLGAVAAVVNVTGLNATEMTDVRVYPSGVGIPTVSLFNPAPGQVTANSTVVGLADGSFDVRNAGGSIDVIVDVMGFQRAPTSGNQAFDRTIIIGGSGSPEANGSMLIGAVSAANTVASASDPWLIKVEPGRYELGASTTGITLEDGVHIEGSGQAATIVTCTCADSLVQSSGDNQIADVTLENQEQGDTIGPPGGMGLRIDSGSTLLLTRTSVIGVGDLVLDNRGTATVSDSEIVNRSSSFFGADGIVNAEGAEITLLNSTITNDASSATIRNYGHATVRGSVVETTGWPAGTAVANEATGTARISNSEVRSIGGQGILGNQGAVIIDNSLLRNTSTSFQASGVSNRDGTLELRNSTVSNAGFSGVSNFSLDSTATATIHNSVVDGEFTAVENGAGANISVFGSALTSIFEAGFVNAAGGTATVVDSSIDATDPVDGLVVCVAVSYVNPNSFNENVCP